MKAIIMAGGEGTRLKSVTGDTPKPMANLCGRPVLWHILQLLKKNGIRDVCISLRYRADDIKNYFGDGSELGMRISYHTESSPLGTAGGVKACEYFYGNRDFLIISGDSACDFDLFPLMEAHRRHKPMVSMALYPVPAPLQYGTVLTDRYDRVISFIEKPSWQRVVSDLINTGIYMVSPEAMKYVPENTAFDFSKDLFPLIMSEGGEIRGIPMEGYWCDIGTPRAYHQCNIDAIDGRLKLESPKSEKAEENCEKSDDSFALSREILCRSRAKIMRLISQSLMEAGADFSSGISLNIENDTLHIMPHGSREAIIVAAENGNSPNSAAFVEKYSEIARDLSNSL